MDPRHIFIDYQGQWVKCKSCLGFAEGLFFTSQVDQPFRIPLMSRWIVRVERNCTLKLFLCGYPVPVVALENKPKRSVSFCERIVDQNRFARSRPSLLCH